LYSYNAKLSIELVCLGLFAAVGALSGSFEFASHWLSRTNPARPFYTCRHPGLILIWIFAGGALASGGGSIRRGLEIGAMSLADATGFTLRECYVPSLTIMWPGAYEGYEAVGWGILVGAAVSILFLHGVSLRLIQDKQVKLGQAIVAIDLLATAFFAAYGIEAGMKFTSSLPVVSATALAFLIVSALFIIPSSMLAGSGGGLMKGIVVDLVLLRPKNMLPTLSTWFQSRTLWISTCTSIFGFVFYQLLTRPPLKFGTCIMLDNRQMFWTLLVCAAASVAAVWAVEP
jgi:hypothetical protein